MISIAMEYLDEINNIIKDSASDQIKVCDIGSAFSELTEEEYAEYIDELTGLISRKGLFNI